MNKTALVLVSLLIAVTVGVGGFFVSNDYVQNLMVEIAGLFLSLSVGVVVVNIFLENKARQAAVKSLLMLIEAKIAEFHNSWMQLAWAEFGRDRWGEIGSEYVDSGGKPEALSLDVRRGICKLLRNNGSIFEKLESLDEGMVELSRLGGWSLDPELLKYCLDFRRSVVSIKSIELDDTDSVATEATEHILDCDIRSGLARNRLRELAGITQD